MSTSRSEYAIDLLSLPLELLCEVARHMDSDGLMAFRRTCKTLCNATKARPIWQNLVAEIESDACIPRILEYAIDGYTTEELEHWVLPRLRVREHLASDCNVPITVRTKGFRRDRSKVPAQILPGGRWMLAFHGNYSQLYVYDLNRPGSPHPERHLLFDVGQVDEEEGTPDILGSYAFWIDPSKSGSFSFRVVVWRTECPDVYGHVTRMCIFRVDRNSRMKSSPFRVQHLATLRSHAFAERPKVAISDRYLVELRKRNFDYRELVLYEYLTVKESSHKEHQPVGSMPLNSLSVRPYTTLELQITPNDQVIVLSEYDFIGALEVYSLSQILSYDRLGEARPSQKRHFTHLQSARSICPLFSFSGSSWLVVAGPGLSLVKVDADSTSYSLSVELVKHLGSIQPTPPREFMNLIGPRASAFLKHDWSLDIASYSWDPETLAFVLIIKHLKAVGREADHGKATEWFIWQFDAVVGRLILFHNYTDNCMIVDIQ
ncbi:hypothetical protein D9756_008285 [Leucocoprinus leucothites]|uniref:F-box domain-containing protein n=1 Tax=Leucocoprinus leucothites TaxID=201217 RepID=A0A8H5FVC7_9AGAR|nr:hypothetical protein D9756_008285 [Leucoagaricus leucothites]